MIEIIFNHKRIQGGRIVDKLSLGHGIPTHGQLDFLSLITEELDSYGRVKYAVWKWSFGWWRIKDVVKRWDIK